MTAIDHIRELLHLLAGILIWPVMIGLIALAATMLVALGAFAREAVGRWRGRRHEFDTGAAQLDAAAGEEAAGDLDLRLERILQREERRVWRAPSRLKLAVRLGPALGLMGTLIPMAYALEGLATGNLPALASNLVTAFAATVIGLAISVVAYLTAAAREHWVRADTQALAFHAEGILRRQTPVGKG